MSFCTGCGHPRKRGAQFCTACGTPLRGPISVEAPGGAGSAEAPGGGTGNAATEDPFGGLFAPARGDTDRDDTATVDVARYHPATAPSRYRTKIIIAALAVVVILAAAGVTAGVVMNRRHVPSGAPVAQQSPTGHASANTTVPGTARPTAPGTSPAASGPGNSIVAVSPSAAGDPAAVPIANLLTRYFTAINKHDYEAYSSLLDPQVQQQMTASEFAQGYRTTTDSGATLTSISTAAGGHPQATVTFTSHQEPSDSPDNSACTNWSITLFLEQDASGDYLVGQAPRGYHATHQPC